MDPTTLVGPQVWQKLEQGEVLTGAANSQFETQRLGWLRKIAKILNPANWLRSRDKSACMVYELKRRSVSVVGNENLLSLKMAAAGIVKIKKVGYGGALVTSPKSSVDGRKVKTFCELPDSRRELINTIENPKTRAKLRVSNFESLLTSDRELLESYLDKGLPVDSWNSPRQSAIKKAVGDTIKPALYQLVDEADLPACIERLKNTPVVQGKIKDRFQYQVDLLILRSALAKAGLISADDMKYSWKYFLRQIREPGMERVLVAEPFLKGAHNGIELMKMVRHFNKDGLVMKLPNPPEFHQHRSMAKRSYRPELERADRSPGLRNLGNKCYYNSMIKLLANQFSMDDLEAMSANPRPLDFTENLDLVNGDIEEDTIAQRQHLHDGLVALLRSVKLCRAGLVDAEVVNKLNREFVNRLANCRLDPWIANLFKRSTQEDAHEFSQVVSKILNHNNNPKFSYNYTHRKQAITGGANFSTKPRAVQERDTLITVPVRKGQPASYETCLGEHLEEERVDYFWDLDATQEIPEFQNIEVVLNSNRRNIVQLRSSLEEFKESVRLFTDDKAYIAAVQTMTLNDQGYFERPLAGGNKELLPLPPWTTTKLQPVLEVDTDQLETMMVMPKLFTFGPFGARKLGAEGQAFFESAVDGMDIPVVDSAGRSATLVMDIKGVSCHSGGMAGGHYVYLEKAVIAEDEPPMWVLNDDNRTTVLGDEVAMKDYLNRNGMTPYVYHLNKQQVLDQAATAIRYQNRG